MALTLHDLAIWHGTLEKALVGLHGANPASVAGLLNTVKYEIHSHLVHAPRIEVVQGSYVTVKSIYALRQERGFYAYDIETNSYDPRIEIRTYRTPQGPTFNLMIRPNRDTKDTHSSALVKLEFPQETALYRIAAHVEGSKITIFATTFNSSRLVWPPLDAAKSIQDIAAEAAKAEPSGP